MKSITRAVFLLVALSAFSEAAYGCMCFLPKNPYKDAKAVFFGKVVEIAAGGAECARVVTFKVERYWKGVGSEFVSLQTPEVGLGCCGYNFSVGESYLIYAGVENGRLETGPCRILAEKHAGKDLKKLGKGKMPKANLTHSAAPPNNGMHPTADTLLLIFL